MRSLENHKLQYAVVIMILLLPMALVQEVIVNPHSDGEIITAAGFNSGGSHGSLEFSSNGYHQECQHFPWPCAQQPALAVSIPQDGEIITAACFNPGGSHGPLEFSSNGYRQDCQHFLWACAQQHALPVSIPQDQRRVRPDRISFRGSSRRQVFLGPLSTGNLQQCQHLAWLCCQQPGLPVPPPEGSPRPLPIAQQNFLSLFERPYENLNNLVPLGTQTIPALSPLQNVLFQTALQVQKDQPFSTFVDSHQNAVKGLTDLFMSASNRTELMHLALKVRDNVNGGLFIHALTHTIYRNRNFHDILVPNLAEIFPTSFFRKEELQSAEDLAKQKTHGVPHIHSYGPNFTGTDPVDYWREDIALNYHHWNWHMSNPCWTPVNNDRKGELFYYMHHQMVARYDMERMSNRMQRVTPLDNWDLPIPEGYNSHLTLGNSGSDYIPRSNNASISNTTSVRIMKQWRRNLVSAINQGSMINSERTRVLLSDDVTHGKRGVDIIGDSFEADKHRSVNFDLYGDLHNTGHNVLGETYGRYSPPTDKPKGVMGFVETAIRDPVFFRWHKFIDTIFDDYKHTQQPYTDQELLLPGVTILDLAVNPTDNGILYTGYSNTLYNVSKGLDFEGKNAVLFNVTHMDHKPFTYQIKICDEVGMENVTVRIFMAPKYSDSESGQPMPYVEQRNLWAEMDRFHVTLTKGFNCIRQHSEKSAITMPPQPSFKAIRDFQLRNGAHTPEEFHRCGLPQHLLLPRGTPDGMTFQVFVMLTDYNKDKVLQPPSAKIYNTGMSYCGIYDGLYPDKRPMGFPFDRIMDSNKPSGTTTEHYFSRYKNTAIRDVTIKFLDNFVEKRELLDEKCHFSF